MLPILISWGPVVLPAWHVFYVLGAVACYVLLQRLAQLYASHIPRPALARLFAISYIAGYFGARLLSILVEEPDVHGVLGWLTALTSFGAMTFYGGAIAAFLAGALYVRHRRLPLPTLLDLGVPAGLLGLAIGRIGCFLNGDDYGKAVADQAAPPFWAVAFPNLDDHVARYPVQLMETFLVTLIVIGLCTNFVRLRLRYQPGAIGLLGAAAYAITRFFLEFLRDDYRGFVGFAWLSTSQFISIVVLGATAATAYWQKKQGPVGPQAESRVRDL